MGTNYYLIKGRCPHCGRAVKKLHIGKSSAGWCFGLHVIPEIGLSTLDDWKTLIHKDGACIEDEYGKAVTPAGMIDTITKRAWGSRLCTLNAKFHRTNHSAPGPYGLLRHKVDGVYCIGHGSGTWDLMVGDFS